MRVCVTPLQHNTAADVSTCGNKWRQERGRAEPGKGGMVVNVDVDVDNLFIGPKNGYLKIPVTHTVSYKDK